MTSTPPKTAVFPAPGAFQPSPQSPFVDPALELARTCFQALKAHNDYLREANYRQMDHTRSIDAVAAQLERIREELATSRRLRLLSVATHTTAAATAVMAVLVMQWFGAFPQP